jgi:hypothetical protein
VHYNALLNLNNRLKMAEPKLPSVEDRIKSLELSFVSMEELTNNQQKQIEELQLKLAQNGSVSIDKKEEPLSIPKKTFSVKGVDYRFKLAAFRLEGVKYLAKDVFENDTLLEVIVKEHTDLIEKA